MQIDRRANKPIGCRCLPQLIGKSLAGFIGRFIKKEDGELSFGLIFVSKVFVNKFGCMTILVESFCSSVSANLPANGKETAFVSA